MHHSNTAFLPDLFGDLKRNVQQSLKTASTKAATTQLSVTRNPLTF
jgi:hypothetical protein